MTSEMGQNLSNKEVCAIFDIKCSKFTNFFTLGLRILLNTLVQAQTENASLARQRLEIEKRRFEYEQSLGDKLLGVLQTIANK